MASLLARFKSLSHLHVTSPWIILSIFFQLSFDIIFFRSCPGAESRRRRPGGDRGRVWHDQHDNKGAKWKERARTEMMSSGLGRHLADGEHQDRVSLLMPSSSKCNLFLPLGHHRRPNLRKGRRQRDKQKLLQRLLSGLHQHLYTILLTISPTLSTPSISG